FYQAEDGIRDRNVTGVQTCALPISEPPEEGGTPQSNRGSAWYEILVNAENPLSADFVPEVTEIRGGNFVDTRILDDLQDMMDDRSEERRVGKEDGYRRRWQQARRDT